MRMPLIIVMAVGLSIGAHAQSWQPPSDAQRCPSKWGAGDQRGSANHMKPEITVQDLQQSLKRQNLTLQPGDAVIIHTGYGRLWGKENGRYSKNCPGLGVAAAEWLARQDPMLVGADNFGVGVSPDRDPQVSNPVHQIMLVVNGIHLLENLKLDDLAAKRVYEFAFVIQPLKIQGGTGSTVAPIAIR